MIENLFDIKNFIEKESNQEVLKVILFNSCEKLSEVSAESIEEQLLLICNFINPNNTRVLTKLANIYYKKNDLAKSLSLAKKAVHLTNHTNINCLMNSAIIAADADQRDYAKEKFDQVLKIDPENSRAKFGLGIESFKEKKYEIAWNLYLNRHLAFDTKQNEPDKIKNLPRWDGNSAGDIYFYNEQGYGDLIFSIRFWHHLKEIANDYSFILDKNMAALISDTPFKKNVNRKLKNPKYKCSVLDLPAIFNDSKFNSDKYEYIFQQHKIKKRKKPKIGITFCGGSSYSADIRRSIHICFLKETISQKNYDFFIFQKEYKNSNFYDKSCSAKEFPQKLENYKTTADALLKMDAIISIDSSVAHLAGALGVPTFILLEKFPDFRWYPFDNKIPWYKSWIPIKQTNRCDWPSAVNKLNRKLDKHFAIIRNQDQRT